MKNKNTAEIVGYLAMAFGFIAELVGQWAGDKQTDALISEKVAEEVAKAMKNVKVMKK